jgi:UDP-N-acetylmuramoyl-tripeptide--D-alanyl-D-alanine ligase
VNGFDYTMPLPGEHIMRNALRAIALGLELGLAPVEIAAGLQKFKLPPMRWETSEIDGIGFINDAYNANPLSMRAALSTFAELPCTGRKFVVLGGMRELGAQSESEHRELGAFVDALNFDGVITIGELGSKIVCNGITGIGKATAVDILRDQLRSDDKVLFKASRGEQLETILEELKAKIL